MLRKLLIGFAILLVLLLGAAVAIPYFFRDEIVAQVKTAANESLNATLDFKNVDISLFRHFPKLSIGFDSLDIVGKDKFDGVHLIRCARFDVAVDLWAALFGSEINIKRVFLDKPDLRIFVLADGSANYDISKPAETSPTEIAEPSPVKISLDRYEIRDGNIFYEDRGLNFTAIMANVNHSGRGEFTSDIFDLVMTTKANSLTVDYEGTRYLLKAKTDWDATLNMDLTKMKFAFKQNSLKINELDVALDGWVELPNDDDITMDLKFGSPENDFKSFLSLLPGAYSKDFVGVQASGKLRFSGFAKGTYNEKSYPAFALDLGIDAGSFKYPALPLGVSGIDVDCKINSPGSDLNSMTVDIPRFSLKIGQNPLAGHFFLKTPMTDPNVDLRLKGLLNLADLSKAYPMEGVKTMAGLINADVYIKARQSQLDAQDYANVNMGGSFDLQNLKYEAAGTPAVDMKSASAKVSPGRIDLPDFDAKLGRSDLKMSGFIDSPLAYFSPEKTMTGSLSFRSFYFDANEWMTPEPVENQGITSGKSPSPTVVTDAPTVEKPFDRWNFSLDGELKKLTYDSYQISDLTAKGNFTPDRFDISNFGLKIGESDLSGDGQILNAMSYLFESQTVAGVVNLNSTNFNLNQFMTEESAGSPKTTTQTTASTNSTAALDPIVVPPNIDMTLNVNFGQLKYDNLTLENLRGKITVIDGVASLVDCVAGTLGGGIALSGSYDTRQAGKPAFDLDFALQNMGFRQAFDNFMTVKKLAPVAQLMDGKFNTSLSMSGLLGKDMMPDFTTLSAAGFLETLAASVKNWKPLAEIGDKLGLESLKSLDLNDTRNWFEIADGKVNVKPFDFKMKDVAMNFGGSHGLSNDMDYKLLAKVPRKLLEKNAAGAAAGKGLNWMTGEAGKIGLNIKQGEFVNVLFSLGGSLFSPKINAKVVGSEGESVKSEASDLAAAAAEKAKDSLRTVAQKEFEKGKKAASDAAQKAIDSLENVARRKADEAATRAAEEAKKKATEVLGEKVGGAVGEKVGEKAGQAADKVLNGQGKKQVDEAKKKLEKWDPFKKKN